MSSNEEKAELIGYPELAQLTGLPKGTLYSLVHRRQIPHIRLGPRLVRFRRTDVAAWMAQGSVTVAEPSQRELPLRQRIRRCPPKLEELKASLESEEESVT